MRPDDPRHGTEAGYEQHRRDDEDPCDACRDGKLRAARRRTKRKTMGHRYTVSSEQARRRVQKWRDGNATYTEISDHVGVAESLIWDVLNDNRPVIYTRTATAILGAPEWPATRLTLTRRVRALVALGWTTPRIADACNVHHDTIIDLRRRMPEFLARKVRDGILNGYADLSMRLPEAATKQEKAGITRARNHAARKGWAPPIAWDDIDNPHEKPVMREHHDGPGRPKRAAAAIEDFDWLVSQGESPDYAAQRVGVTLSTIEQYRRRVMKEAS